MATMIDRFSLLAVAFLLVVTAYPQADDLAVMTPPRPFARTADDARIELTEGSTPGMATLRTPEGTYQLDVLNVRGKVVRSTTTDLDRLDVRKLRPGTWTLRAHTPEGILVRRFMVFERGSIAWAAPVRTGRSR
jgi:hypothetical protein